jgi:hypothetical protein
MIVATAKYHQLQAKTLLELASSTSDLATAEALRQLAAEHTELAIAADSPNGKPRTDQQ